MIIAFLESSGQAEAALLLSPRPDVLLPLSPMAAARLESAGVPYTKAESLYDEGAFSAAADEILDAEASWTAWVDAWLMDREPTFKEAGFRPAAFDFFRLKVMFDALYMRAFVLRAVAETLKPSKAIYFHDEKPWCPSPDLSFRESLNALCMDPWSRAVGVPVERRSAAGDERFFRPPYSPKLDLSLIPKAWRRLRRLAAARLKRRAQGRRILVREGYDVDFMLPYLVERGFSPVPWPEFLGTLHPPLAPGPPVPWEVVAGEPRWAELTRPLGIDLSGVAQERLKFWWNRVIPESWTAFRQAREALKARDIESVLVPLADTHQDVAVLQAARSEGVPVFIYQHGGYNGACEYTALEFTDLLQCEKMLVYGEGVADHYAARLKRYREPRAATIPVGSARLDNQIKGPHAPARLRARLNAGREHDEPLAIYFPARHAAYVRYLCRDEMPDVSHWELQRDIVRCFKDFPSVRLIYRPYEGWFESPVPGLLETELPSASIEREASLPDLLRAVDFILVDMPSTGLLEALGTNRPILAYSDARAIGLKPEARELLARRASVDGEPEAYLRRVRAFLSAGDFRPVVDPDTSFLRTYGTHLGDGRSAERAAQIVATARPPARISTNRQS